jgi:hypothetical protein
VVLLYRVIEIVRFSLIGMPLVVSKRYNLCQSGIIPFVFTKDFRFRDNLFIYDTL